MELTPLRLCIYSINIYQNPCFFKRQYQDSFDNFKYHIVSWVFEYSQQLPFQVTSFWRNTTWSATFWILCKAFCVWFRLISRMCGSASAQFRDILGRIPWVMIPETREAEEGFLRITFLKFKSGTSWWTGNQSKIAGSCRCERQDPDNRGGRGERWLWRNRTQTHSLHV